ncbi:MAG TPA: hypothetical protein VLR27_14780 [Acidimicrobiales bacterium]|nr:hypothetical protein [Acidimicrobiales bacterium]
MSDRPEDPGMPGGPPTEPPPPPPPPVQGATVTLDSETEVRAGGVGGRIVAGAVGLVLLLGGVAFAATQIGSDDGASDPEAAVAELFDAIADEDVLGMLATLDPGERDALSQPVERFFGELERLEVLDDSFELSGVAGVDLEFEDLTFRTEPVRSDLTRVYLTGGTASFAVDTDEIPVGDFLADTFDRFGVEYRGVQQSESDTLDPAEADDTFLVVRDTGDGWRVSLGYTAVEAARVAQGAPVPAAGAGLAAIGADTPEEAVEGFLQAAVGIDIEGVVARLSPGELRAVHDYWPVLVGGTDLPTADDVPADIALTDLSLRSSTDGDRGRVFIDSIGVDVVTEDFEGGATIADGCIEVRGDIRDELDAAEVELPDGPICRDDIDAILEDAAEEMGGANVFGFGGMDGLAMGDGDAPELGITVVHIDEKGWFVAPMGTWADLGLAVLETIDREDLDAMVDAVEEFFGSGFFGGGMLGGGFVPPGMTDDLGGFEDFDDEFGYGETEVEVETFEELGDPIGGNDLDATLAEMVEVFAGDPDVAACALEQLRLKATPDQLFELADAYQYEYEPSMEAQDVLFGVLSSCGG